MVYTLSNFFRGGLFLLAGLVLVSCEQAVDLELEELQPQVVINSQFTPGHPFRVTVSKSQNVLNAAADEFLTNAKVTVLNADGRALETLRLETDRRPIYQSRQLQPSVGRTYHVRVETEGGEVLTASDYLPFPVALKQLRMDTIDTFLAGENRVHKVAITVSFDDPVGMQDHYHLVLYRHLRTTDGPTHDFNPNSEAGDLTLLPFDRLESDENNPPLTFHHEPGGVLFADEQFDGQTTTLTFYTLLTESEELTTDRVVGELRSVSNDYYRFNTTVSRQLATQNNPFAQPVRVYSNVENGLGIFAGYAVYRDSLATGNPF